MSERANINPVPSASKDASEAMLRRLLGQKNSIWEWHLRRDVLGEDEQSRAMRILRNRIRISPEARTLLSNREADGTIAANPYRKWQGPHWTLASLADIGYPPGDRALQPLLDQAYGWMLEPRHLEFPRSAAYSDQPERFRRCASQEGNAIRYALLLGLADARTEELARRLVRWQWPDGGWNCDKRESARTSSVMETLVPLRALSIYAAQSGDRPARLATERAAEFLLERQLLWRKRDGREMQSAFLQIEIPHRVYDILFALLVMAETGYLRDPRCQAALNLLESKQLPDGGFPAERKTYVVSPSLITRGSYADWGPHSKRASNPWATAHALAVLRAAGRLTLPLHTHEGESHEDS
jgi:hypothetical protein